MNGVLSHAESTHSEVPLPKASTDNTGRNKLDDSFFDMLMRCQVSILTVDILVFAAVSGTAIQIVITTTYPIRIYFPFNHNN